MKVKVIGAGSIGNHLSNAARTLGWDVVLTDADEAALKRTREEIYPGRYGAWDDRIQLCHSEAAPVGGFDIIFIGTPPDSHMSLALKSIEEKPRLVFVEKPYCPPSLEGAVDVAQASAKNRVPVIVGFDHSVSQGIGEALRVVRSGVIGKPVTHDVEFRESWSGIFKAHPWLAGPHDSYLGFWKRGGGASSEHSHALHLWLYLSQVLGFGDPEVVSAAVVYEEKDGCQYDSIFSLNLSGKQSFGRVIQDVITVPTRKCARIQGENGVVEWFINYSSRGDAIITSVPGKEPEIHEIAKTRPDDFIAELKHIESALNDADQFAASPLRMDLGLLTARVVAAAHQSASEGRLLRLEGITP